jgi:DNA-binding transcriptional MerR regulator
MNEYQISGFIKKAQNLGLSNEAIRSLLKEANDGGMPAGGPPPMDPSAGAGGPPPMDPSAGGPPGAGGGVPPEIEQLIQQLPPEVLQQLVQEIEAELANGGQGGGQPPVDPSAGGGQPPMDPSMMAPKTGSVKRLIKESKYIEGFKERALSYGLSYDQVNNLYKTASEIVEQSASPESEIKHLSCEEKQAAHKAGFIERAAAYGINTKEAEEIYKKQL